MHPRQHMEAGAEAFRDRVTDKLGDHLRHLEARLAKDPKDATLQQLAAQLVWLRAQVLAMPLVED
jgi:hypothetical protein